MDDRFANAEQDMTPDFDDGADIEQMDYPSDYPVTTPDANVEFEEIMEPETGDVQRRIKSNNEVQLYSFSCQGIFAGANFCENRKNVLQFKFCVSATVLYCLQIFRSNSVFFFALPTKKRELLQLCENFSLYIQY